MAASGSSFEKSLFEQTTTQRIQSVDIVRGLIMVLMVIDHVRVYSGLQNPSYRELVTSLI